MQAGEAMDLCEECRKAAKATADVDRQSLLHFLADAWRAIAASGDASSAIPLYLRSPPNTAIKLH